MRSYNRDITQRDVQHSRCFYNTLNNSLPVVSCMHCMNSWCLLFMKLQCHEYTFDLWVLRLHRYSTTSESIPVWKITLQSFVLSYYLSIWSCISSLPKLPSQCYSNRTGNFGNLGSNNNVHWVSSKLYVVVNCTNFDLWDWDITRIPDFHEGIPDFEVIL